MKADAETEESFRRCEELSRKAGSNFLKGFRFLEPSRRKALNALYAFARITDDIVDEDAKSLEERRARLGRWRAATERVLDGGRVEDPYLPALGYAARRFGIGRETLLMLVDGCEQDLTKNRYETFSEVRDYCYKVAVTVGMAMLAIFGARKPEAARAMESVGYAFQFTNILRDIPEDFQRGRIYLPRKWLREFSLPEDDVGKGVGTRPELRRVLERLGEEAWKEYEKGYEVLSHLPPRAGRSIAVMLGVYREILVKIRKAGYDVWADRPRLSAAEKAWITFRETIRFRRLNR